MASIIEKGSDKHKLHLELLKPVEPKSEKPVEPKSEKPVEPKAEKPVEPKAEIPVRKTETK